MRKIFILSTWFPTLLVERWKSSSKLHEPWSHLYLTKVKKDNILPDAELRY
jgi:hypothetical protein